MILTIKGWHYVPSSLIFTFLYPSEDFYIKVEANITPSVNI